MKALLTLGACLAAALTLSAQTQNLLVDPSFELPDFAQTYPIPIPGGVGGGWAAFQATLTTAQALSGGQSVYLSDNTWNPSGVYQILNAIPGSTYTASAWFENAGAASSFGTPFLIELAFHDSTGAPVDNPSIGWTTEELGTWKPLTITAMAPAATAYVYAYFMAMDGPVATGAQYYVDNASLTGTVVPETSTLALLGLGLVGILAWRRRQ